jgi:O-antigen/teichoic acid export membrane protein
MSLRKQAASLAVMHAADVIQPLLVLPYAGRVLGLQHFGEYAYAISLGQFAATIVEYGFHWTAQREAASTRQEPAAIALLFAEVAAVKVTLCFAVTLAGLVAAGPFLAVSKTMFLAAMLTAVGGILFPPWLLIGLERASQAAFAVVVARTLALICFLTMVTSPAQVERAVAIQSAIPLVAGVVSLPFVAGIGFSGLKYLTLHRVVMQFRSGWRGFLFTFVERASMTLPIPLVGHFSGYIAAGEYSIAEKFVSATRPFFRVMSETFLPRVAFHARHDPEAGLKLIWRTFLTLFVGAALSLGLFFIAPYVIIMFFGESFSGAIPIVRVMSVIPLLLNISMCTSNLYMFNYGHERAWSALTVTGLLVLLAVAYFLSPHVPNAAIALAVAVVAKETVVCVVSGSFFLRFSAVRRRASTNFRGVNVTTIAPPVVRADQLRRNQLRSEM